MSSLLSPTERAMLDTRGESLSEYLSAGNASREPLAMTFRSAELRPGSTKYGQFKVHSPDDPVMYGNFSRWHWQPDSYLPAVCGNTYGVPTMIFTSRVGIERDCCPSCREGFFERFPGGRKKSH
jgi:hypothetical protein